MIKLRRTFKAIAKRLKKPAKIASKRGHKAVHFTRKQLRIRPRIHLSFGVLVTLVVMLIFSGYMVTYLRPKEAKVKINGQPILAAQRTQEPIKQEVVISQAVIAHRSPFDFRKPIDNGYISQGFSSYHAANDIAGPFGTPIHPVGSGVVKFAGYVTDGRGNEVIIDHGDGLQSLYAHMNTINVGIGNVVNSSAEIGTVGLTGHTTGPHVHLEIHDGDVSLDPASVLPN